MAYSINYSLFFLIIITTIVCSSINLTLGVDEVDFEGVARVCYGNSTTSNGSTGEDYQNNVRLLLSVLVSQSTSLHPPMTYISTSVGRVAERAYGSYLCRADLSLKQCHNCLVNLTDFMSDLKTDNSECIGFGRFLWCMVHYSNSPKFSTYQKGLVFSYNSIGKNVSNYEQYNNTLSNTIQGLVTEAGIGNWAKANFGTRVVEVTGSHEKIFVLVQCAADLSPMNCSNCLGELYSYVPDCCNGSQGGLLVHANCLMKYNNQSFFGLASHSFMPSYVHVLFLLLFTMYFIIM